MKDEKNSVNDTPEITNQKSDDDFIKVFSYFEEASATNRAAFSELLDYSYKNIKNDKR